MMHTLPKFLVSLNWMDKKSGFIHISYLVIIWGIIILSVLLLSIKIFSKAPLELEASVPQIDITQEAVQTVYQGGVPHLDKDGNLRTTFDPNLSVFHNGIFWVSEEPKDSDAVSQLTSAGFNMAMTIKDQNPQFLIDQITGDDFKVIINTWLDFDQDFNYDPNSFDENLFQTHKDNPNVIAFWLADEPYKIAKANNNDPSINLNVLNQVYQDHKDLTAKQLFITEGYIVPTDSIWQQFVNLTDLANVYQYPKFFTNVPVQTMEITAAATQEMVSTIGSSKPAWLTPQLFNEAGFVYLTPTEEKAQIYTTLIHGSTGLLHFIWDTCHARNYHIAQLAGVRPNIASTYPDCDPDALVLSDQKVAEAQALWNTLDAAQGGINSEIQQLTPALLSPTVNIPYTVLVDQTPISQAPIRTLLKQVDGQYYLLAVNIDNATIETQFNFPLTIDGQVEKLFEGGFISPSIGGTISDTFAPFEVHVYRFLEAIDTDSDGFPDNIELTIGTDPTSACSLTSSTDAWPPDIDASGNISLFFDIFPVANSFGKTSADPDWDQHKRHDMNADGQIDLFFDIFGVANYFGQTFCP